jgi:DNA polymerase III delta prime subunit
LLPVSEKIQAARDIRANINNLNKNMFPEKITDETYNKILELLTNNIMEKTIKKDKFTLLFESFMNDLVNEGRKCV